MEINSQIKNKVRDSQWRAVPYRNGGSPKDTFGEIVTDSFEEASRIVRCATHCTLAEMYTPTLGDLRQSKSYSALAPTNGMRTMYNKYTPNRRVEPDLRPYTSYKPKQGEWLVARGQPTQHAHHYQHTRQIIAPLALPLAPMSRRQYPVPASTTRFENFSRYWNGRAKGLEYAQPFLYDTHRDNYDITEDRRYQRLFWASRFIPSQPSARHSRQIILTAY